MTTITRATAAASLESPDSLVRLEAARTLAEKGDNRDRRALVRALNREHDPWVRRELGLAIRAVARHRSRVEIADLSDDARLDELRAAMTQELSELFLHEVRPLVGEAKLAATTEVDDYDSSDTKRILDRLSDLLEALGVLNRAATAPLSVDEFDVGDVCARLLRAQLGPDCDLEPLLGGTQPAGVTANRSLFEIIVSNGIRNAIESVRERGEDAPCQGVVISWGSTDAQHWVTVIDDGIGLPNNAQLFEIGFSTKPKDSNFGLGLAIAARAAKSIGGEVSLTVRQPAGAVFELRWPRRGVVGADPRS